MHIVTSWSESLDVLPRTLLAGAHIRVMDEGEQVALVTLNDTGMDTLINELLRIRRDDS